MPTGRRICTHCKIPLPPAAFYRRRGNCRKCERAYQKRHYQRRRRFYIARATARKADRRSELQARVAKLKAVPCTDCRKPYPPHVMQFDHVRGVKSAAISNMVRSLKPFSKIVAEIAKCEPVCANCHADRTHRRRHPQASPPPFS